MKPTLDKKSISIGIISLILGIYLLIYVTVKFVSQPNVKILTTERGIPLEFKFSFPPIFILFAIAFLLISYEILVRRKRFPKNEFYVFIICVIVTFFLLLLFGFIP